ncbi:hypothetical protein ACFYWN_12135 [Streptomyces sp. NPDC002917]|uniref:hypothetical protein n=1 Tax=Streptomyces sp. NPDC002917 TaxID=3364671 RepID=UPI003689B06F
MTMRITSPVAGYTGHGPGGVQFIDSIGESADPAVIGYCQGAGYLVELLDDTAPPEPDPDPDPTPEPEPEPTAPQAKAAGRSRTRKHNEHQEVTTDAASH